MRRLLDMRYCGNNCVENLLQKKREILTQHLEKALMKPISYLMELIIPFSRTNTFVKRKNIKGQ